MKRIIRDNINSTYTLHDMNVFSFEVTDNDIVMSVCLFIASDMPLIKFTSFLLVFESFITHFVVFLPGIISGLLYISREQKRKPLYQQILLKV